MIMNVIIEDESSNAPDQDDLVAWSEQYVLTMPVVADAGSSTLYSYATGGSIGLPFTALLDRGVLVESVEYPGAQDAINLLAR